MLSAVRRKTGQAHFSPARQSDALDYEAVEKKNTPLKYWRFLGFLSNGKTGDQAERLAVTKAH